MTALILDTNVIVAALCGHRTASSRVVLNAVVDRQAELVLCDDLLAEYARKLHHPAIMSRHPYSASRLATLLDDLLTIGTLIPIDGVQAPVCPDPSDDFLWRLLAADHRTSLVTWEKALLEATDFPGRVLTPPDALAALRR